MRALGGAFVVDLVAFSGHRAGAQGKTGQQAQAEDLRSSGNAGMSEYLRADQADVAQRAFDHGFVAALGQWGHGQAQGSAAQAHAGHGPLHGMGLASTNRFLCTASAGTGFPWRAHVARNGGHAQFVHQARATLAVTLMLPWPPHSIRATAVGSSPEYTAEALGHFADQPLRTRSMLPVAL